MSIDTESRQRPVMVAVNNTDASAAAVRWAALEANRLGTRLEVIHVDDPGSSSDRRLERDPVGSFRLRQQRVVRRVADSIGPHVADVDVTVQVTKGRLSRTLTRAGRDAQLIVLGSPTCTAHAHLAEELAATCGCRVAVVDGSGRARVASRADRPDQRRARVSVALHDAGSRPCWSERS